MLYKLKKALDSQRYEHTLGVAETARQMAKCFGENEEKAELAGLLHDCAKCLPLEKMVKAAKEQDLLLRLGLLVYMNLVELLVIDMLVAAVAAAMKLVVIMELVLLAVLAAVAKVAEIAT